MLITKFKSAIILDVDNNVDVQMDENFSSRRRKKRGDKFENRNRLISAECRVFMTNRRDGDKWQKEKPDINMFISRCRGYRYREPGYQANYLAFFATLGRFIQAHD